MITGTSIVNEAKTLLGIPYVWGGTTTAGFDCSGFIQYVYSKLGVSIGRTTYDQVKQGTEISKSDLQAGDIVFFGPASSPDHEALYVGNGNVIEAPHTGDVVKQIPLSSFSDYATARRIDTTSGSSTDTSGVIQTGLGSSISSFWGNLTSMNLMNDIKFYLAYGVGFILLLFCLYMIFIKNDNVVEN